MKIYHIKKANPKYLFFGYSINIYFVNFDNEKVSLQEVYADYLLTSSNPAQSMAESSHKLI